MSGSEPAAAAHGDEGAVAVLTALVVTVVVLPLMALVVDLGMARAVEQQATAAADSAALAAAGVLAANPDALSDAVTAAQQYAEVNFGRDGGADAGEPLDWSSCTDPTPLPAPAVVPGNCVSVDLVANVVQVRLPARSMPNIFSGLLHRAPPTVSATARASWTEPTVAGPVTGAGGQPSVRLVP